MSSNKMQTLFIGATGFIGGPVLHSMLSMGGFDVSAIIRKEDKLEGYRKLGVKPIHGSYSDSNLLANAVKQADLVVSVANADDEEFIATVLKAMKERKQSTGNVPTLLHVSGTGVMVTFDDGEAPKATAPKYDDTDVQQMKGIPKDAPHRPVDLQIMAADEAGDIVAYLVLPTTIYGTTSKHVLGDGKLANPFSDQMPTLVRAGIKRKQARMYGAGENIWPHVHIDDLVEGFDIILKSILARDGKASHGWNGFYVFENGMYQYGKAAKEIAKALKENGAADTDEVKSFSKEELREVYGDEQTARFAGTNCQAQAKRARSLGWKPSHTTDDFYQSLHDDTKSIIKAETA